MLFGEKRGSVFRTFSYYFNIQLRLFPLLRCKKNFFWKCITTKSSRRCMEISFVNRIRGRHVLVLLVPKVWEPRERTAASQAQAHPTIPVTGFVSWMPTPLLATHSRIPSHHERAVRVLLPGVGFLLTSVFPQNWSEGSDCGGLLVSPACRRAGVGSSSHEDPLHSFCGDLMSCSWKTEERSRERRASIEGHPRMCVLAGIQHLSVVKDWS